MFESISDTLPLFCEYLPDAVVYYTPGYAVCVRGADADDLAARITAEDGTHPLMEQARAVTERLQQPPPDYSPECLTLYLNNECNLACSYCFVAPPNRPGTRITPDSARVAAEVVASNCKAKGLPLTVVFHGGGEPTLNLPHLKALFAVIEDVADSHGLERFTYLATNGVMTEEKAHWIAEHFDLIGLSCDGDPVRQDLQRPQANGRPSSDILQRTAQILRQKQQKFHVRSTITIDAISQQAQITHYICAVLQPAALHFEPVYAGRRVANPPPVEQARDFVRHFQTAQRVAAGFGVPLTCSGSRIHQLHGPYCNVFRQVLNVVPGGMATACFKLSRAENVVMQGMRVGRAEDGTYEIDTEAVTQLRNRLTAQSAVCDTCFNQFHCTKGCPDFCPMDARDSAGTFRCEVNKQLAYAEIMALAAQQDQPA